MNRLRLHDILNMPHSQLTKAIKSNTSLSEVTYIGKDEHERQGASFVDASSNEEGVEYCFIRINDWESFFSLGQLDEYDEERRDDLDILHAAVEKHAYKDKDGYVTAIGKAADKRIKDFFFTGNDTPTNLDENRNFKDIIDKYGH